MKLKNNYFKVELKINYENHIHIEKDLYDNITDANDCFSVRWKTCEYGFLQNRFNEYSLSLAECDSEQKLVRVHKIRKAPL